MIEKKMDYIVANPKRMMAASFLLLALSLAFLGMKYVQTGELVERSIDFKSGTQAVIEYEGDVDLAQAMSVVQDTYGKASRVRLLGGISKTIVIETDAELKENDVYDIAGRLGVSSLGVSVQSIGAALGQAFWNQALQAFLGAFLLMAVVVFISFRNFVPSLAVILAGASDITAAVAGMNILGIQLSMGTLAALLILMGYSIDTDILLSTRVLKRKGEGSLDERIKSSMRTGITMSVTSIVAMVILFLVSSSPALDDIALVIIIGLMADIPYTWLQNVGILKVYMERTAR